MAIDRRSEAARSLAQLKVGVVLHNRATQPTGVPRASLELLRALLELPAAPEVVVLGDEPLCDLVKRYPDVGRVPLPRATRIAASALERSVGLRITHLTCVAAWLPTVARQQRLDVLHDFTGLAPFPRKLGQTFAVATVHDLVSHGERSTNDVVDDFVQRRWLPWALSRVDAVVTVSETVTAEVRRVFGLPGTPVVSVPHGVDHELQLVPEPMALALPPGPYLLAVGASSERKNLQAVVRAARGGWLAGRLPPLVMVGPLGRVAQLVLAEAQRLGVQEYVTAVGYVADSTLRNYYRHAVALIYPSLDEGFGLPVLEAMRHGTPVLTSARGATAEIAGDAALLVDPMSEEQIRDGLLRIAGDDALRADLSERGRRRAAEFTWERSAQKLVTLYTDLQDGACG